MSTWLRVVSMVAAAGLLAGAAAPVVAADSKTVDVTVTVAAPCITVGPESIDYGTHEFSGPGEFDPAGTAVISYQNCGGLPEVVYGRATDAIGLAAQWNLGNFFPDCVNGPVNEFALSLVRPPGPQLGYRHFYLGEVDRATDESLPAGGLGFYPALWLYMPCAGSDGVNEQMSMQVTFTASY